MGASGIKCHLSQIQALIGIEEVDTKERESFGELYRNLLHLLKMLGRVNFLTL